jgi:F-type H+-transporting ATPase subunit b
MLEVLQESLHEIQHDPITFAIELVQFAILIFIIWVVAIGIGKRQGMLVKMLADRRERVAADLEEAAEREMESASAPERAAQLRADAERRVAEIRADARQEAEQERARVLETTAEEIAEIERQTVETLERERSEALGGVNEQLVDVVTAAVRQILDEGFTPAQQRKMIQDAITKSLDDLESVSLS